LLGPKQRRLIVGDIIDQADVIINQDRDRRILAAQAELNRVGEQYCIDCDEEIPSERRMKMPSAIRCVGCQEEFEGTGRKVQYGV
jgi:phage/conjugal plasmid C-4 type zinc finger TraR family protein